MIRRSYQIEAFGMPTPATDERKTPDDEIILLLFGRIIFSTMIYKLICAALLISCGEALKIPAVVSRRTAITQAASIALPMVASPAFALNRAEDADIYKRADEGKLSAERALERAKKDDLVDGSSATVSHGPLGSVEFPHQRCCLVSFSSFHDLTFFVLPFSSDDLLCWDACVFVCGYASVRRA